MKKVILGTFLAAFFGLSYAQSSNVTVYGTIGNSTTTTKQGTSPVGTSAQQNAARDYLYTTNLGVKGTEDLGSGLTAKFVLEGDLNATSGTVGTNDAIFNRFSYIELASVKLGSFSMGRQNDAIKDMSFYGQVYNLSDTPNNGMLVGARYTNVSKYVTPEFYGFKAVYAYSNNPFDTNTGNDGSKTLNSYGVFYNRFGINAAVASAKITEIGIADKQTDRIGVKTVIRGVEVGGNYTINEQAENKTKQTMVSASVPFAGSYEFKTHYVNQDVQGTALTTNGKDGSGFGAMVVKNFSKRTAAYAGYNKFEGTTQADDNRITTVGLVHKF